MDVKPPILQLPVEILQKIAYHACPQPWEIKVLRSRWRDHAIFMDCVAEAQAQLQDFGLTCKAFEKASFDILLQRFPRHYRLFVDRTRNIENFRTQTSQSRLATKLERVALVVDSLNGRSIEYNIQTAENEHQDLEAAQLFDYYRIDAEFYEGDGPLAGADLLASALRELSALTPPPAIDISIRLSEEVYLDTPQKSSNKIFMISDLMSTVPKGMLRNLNLGYVHCNPHSLLELIRRSHDTLEQFDMDRISFVSEGLHWWEVLQELTHCSKLKLLTLTNPEEGSSEVLPREQDRQFLPYSDHFHKGFAGVETVAAGLRSLIEFSPETTD